jgi:hypothetical protein
VEWLARQPLIHADRTPFDHEHALEIQLPFIQVVLPEARLVPVVVGALHGDDAGVLAGSLRPTLEAAGTVAVVSSDFTHYGAAFDYLPFPSTDGESVRCGLRALDEGAIELIVAGAAEEFEAYVARTGATICGRAPISVFLRARPRRGRAACLDYYTSFDVTGDREHSVSYAAVAFWDE